MGEAALGALRIVTWYSASASSNSGKFEGGSTLNLVDADKLD